MFEIPDDPIDRRKELAVDVAHEMCVDPQGAPIFIFHLVSELVDRTSTGDGVVA